ncbi:DUF431-domain-containing protein [Polychaeton citri CBS 116435]|uniref:DUF431-domain-containing protein n=1 Tax=Polychaeton citri CBS 116435 TaxID=1314669 RepID=A0A9P4Q772_9PEZI|nr:DUF431-domain-containing protein [Polychaeton citri CBS 116435]
MVASQKTYVVEHLDPELEEWQVLEYTTIAKECAKANASFKLTGVPQSLLDTLPKQLAALASSSTIEQIYGVEGKGRICLLDPKGASDLAPADGNDFDIFLFGGILGDDPPRDRTSELRAKGFQGRRLGKEQMTTDTAARVTRIVVQEDIPLDQIPYVNQPDIEVTAGETVSMPFKYVKAADGRPIMPEGMHELLAQDADKGILDLL